MRLSVRALIVTSLAAGLVWAALPEQAQAGGFEYPAPGTRALGRGGAFYARADDPMALLYNPAALGSLGGTQLMLNAHLGFFDACHHRAGTYDGGSLQTIFSDDGDPAPFAFREFPEVCNSGPVAPSPNLGFTMNLARGLGMGFGIFAPAAAGHTVWGDENGTVEAGGLLLPSPNRYVLTEEQLIILYPTVGVGYRPAKWIQFGGSFQWGLGLFEFTNYTRPFGGEDPENDIRSELSAQDLFIPAVILSVHAIPHDNLDIVLSARWVDDVRGNADLTLTTGAYGTSMPDSLVPTDHLFEGATLTSPQPWQLAFGIRYADRITARPDDTSAVERLSGRVEDPMSNERWDIEFNAVYELNRRVDDFVIDIPAGSSVVFNQVDAGGTINAMSLPIPREIRIAHDWSDQLSLRLGGDYNVIPGMASVRLGASFETRGVNKNLQQLDFWPAQRFGIHGGLTVRLGRFDISLAYAHIFQETITVSEADAGLVQISAAPTTRTVNAGTYEANFDILSIGLNYHL